MSVYCNEETVATNTIYYDTPAIENGSTCAQLFVGTRSLVSYAYGMKTDKQFVNTFKENIRTRGKMSKLISNYDKSEVRNFAHSILWELFIDDLEK